MSESDPDAAAGGVSRTFDMPYLMRDLDNGLRVIIVRTDYPDIVNLQIPVQVGTRNEVEAGRSGFAHFFEHTMYRGTEAYSSSEYTAIMKKAGALGNAFTKDDYTNFHTTFTKDDLEKMIELEADRFRNLAYSEEEFRTEAQSIKGEYLQDYSSPVIKGFELVRKLSFDEHPYRHVEIGFPEDIEAMPEQFDYSRQFFSRWYRPEKTALIIVGDVDPEETYGLVQKYWGGWERGDHVAEVPVEPQGEGPRYEHIQWQSEIQPWLFIGFRSPAFRPGEKDYPAMRLISSIYFSDSSDLYQELVIDQQWADLLLTDFPFNKDPNLNLIYVRLTDESHVAEVEMAVLEALARARTELIDPERLSQTKSRLRYSFLSTLDNSASIGEMLADYVQFDRTPETVNDLYASFGALTAEDVRRIANEYFTDQTRVTVSVSPSEAIAEIGRERSLDQLAASRESGEVEAEPVSSVAEASVMEQFPATGEPVPVALVARPSASSPLVDVSILVHSGAAMDPPGKKGLAALTAAMITDGSSGTWSIQQINNAMYPIASGFDAQVDKEMTRLSGQVHKDNLATWYRYARSQLINPGWFDADFERVRTQLVNGVRSGLVGDNDEELGKEVLYESVYGSGHPYGSLNLGHSGDIASLTLNDVIAFYRDNYVVSNLTVGVSGGYPESFIAQLGADLQHLPAGARAAISLPEIPPADSNSVTIVEKETQGVAVSFGFPVGLKRGDPDWLALWLARSWLGEHRSENSHLFQRIREERGMNYGDYAYVEYFPNGMFELTPPTNLGRQQQIFQVWIRPVQDNNAAHFATRAAVYELDKLVMDGLSETDFEATRTYLAKSVSLLTDGQSRQLGYELDSLYYGIDNFTDYVRDGLAELTLSDVNRVIREQLRSDNLHYVFVTRDAEDLQERLVENRASPIRYDSEMPASLIQEDEHIASLSLGVEAGDIEVVPAESVFE